jgi:methionine-rich copper-binding protein CopC
MTKTNATLSTRAMLRRSGTLRTGIAIALAAVFFAVLAVPASAAFHLRLVRSDPAADATLATPPSALRLTFSEPPELAVTSVRLVGPGDRAIALARLVRARGDRATVVATPRATLAHGRDALTWRTMSKDGHAMHGTFHFTVGGAGHDHAH